MSANYANPNRARQEAARLHSNTAHKKAIPSANNLPHVNSDGPQAYFITFATYGTWLHGDDRGTVDRNHNTIDTPILQPNPRRRHYEQQLLKHKPIILDEKVRKVVHRTILEVANHRDWTVHAIHVRTNHVHIVISADQPPERIMNQLKSWSSRRLVEAGLLQTGTRTWVRHGSTRYLWKQHDIDAACQYVVEGQGLDD